MKAVRYYLLFIALLGCYNWLCCAVNATDRDLSLLKKHLLGNHLGKSLLLAAYDVPIDSSSAWFVEKCFSVTKWAGGPFVMDTVLLPTNIIIQTLRNLNLSQSENLLERISRVEGISFLLFDDLDDPLSFLFIELKENFNSPLELRRFLDQRYSLSVKFILDNSSKEPVIVKWAHFRGNTKIVDIGYDNGPVPLVVFPGDYVHQYTRAGHVFVVSRFDKNNSTEISFQIDTEGFSQENKPSTFDKLMKFDEIVSLVLISGRHRSGDGAQEYVIDGTVDTTLPIKAIVAGANDMEVNELMITNKQLIMKYWELQRSCQSAVNIWAVDPIPSNPNYGYSSNAKFESNNEATAGNLWTKIQLDALFTNELRLVYANSRRVASDASMNDIASTYNEPPVSQVFNQDAATTRYIPLPDNVMSELIRKVTPHASDWLQLSPELLKLTGFYGCREYTKGAIIRWHVDPAESQPLTVILHLDHSSGETTYEDWEIQLPYATSRDCGNNDINLDCLRDFYDNILSDHDQLVNVTLKPGEALLIQSAKLPHARLETLKMDWYANAFMHFAPIDWTSRSTIQLLT